MNRPAKIAPYTFDFEVILGPAPSLRADLAAKPASLQGGAEATADLVAERVPGDRPSGGDAHHHPKAGVALMGDVPAGEEGELPAMNSPTNAEASNAARPATTR